MRKTVFLLVAGCMLPLFLWAHEVRPGYLEIQENTDRSLTVTWKQPVMGEISIPIRPYISNGWLVDSLANISYTETFLMKRWHLLFPLDSLDKQVIGISGLEETMTDVFIQIIRLDGTSYQYLIKPVQASITLDFSRSDSLPVWQYFQMGVHHIWFGFDHLLFVLGLLLLVRKKSRLFWTITAFTMAHSITLALATLDMIRVPSAFTEAAIALSIVFLAVELMRHYRGVYSLTYQYPWLVSFLFGLLHGLGFSGALQEVGLPKDNIPMALFLFNAGVEAGQLVFVFAVVLLMKAWRNFRLPMPAWSYQVPAYCIGTLAMFWLIERIAGIL